MRKLLKRSGWIASGVLVLLIAAAYLFPAEQHVEKNIRIDAQLPRVFELVNNFHNWNNWFAYDLLDPELNVSYSNPSSGDGAYMHWEETLRKGRRGNLTISQVDPLEHIGLQVDARELKMEGLDFHFALVDGEVDVRMETTRQFSWLRWNRYAGFF